MTDFSPGAIVRVPFPYTNRATRQHRPAVVVSDGGIGADAAILWVIMVTSAENRRWPGDVSLEIGHREMGLPVPSLARTAKIASVDRAAVEWRGDIGPGPLSEIRTRLRDILGFPAPGAY